METVFRDFYIWCCQFVIGSTAFLVIGNWLIRRHRATKRKAVVPLATPSNSFDCPQSLNGR